MSRVPADLRSAAAAPLQQISCAADLCVTCRSWPLSDGQAVSSRLFDRQWSESHWVPAHTCACRAPAARTASDGSPGRHGGSQRSRHTAAAASRGRNTSQFDTASPGRAVASSGVAGRGVRLRFTALPLKTLFQHSDSSPPGAVERRTGSGALARAPGEPANVAAYGRAGHSMLVWYRPLMLEKKSSSAHKVPASQTRCRHKTEQLHGRRRDWHLQSRHTAS